MATELALGPGDVADVLDSAAQLFADVRAVAFGAKSIGGVLDFERHAVTFFVPEKRELSPDGQTLADGSPRVPATIEVGGAAFETDVVALSRPPATGAGVITGEAAYVPGGKISAGNGSVMGTMACLVQNRTTGRVMALTNRHIAPTVGGFAYFYRNTNWFLRQPILGAIRDETFGRFFGLAGPADQVIRVDASVVEIEPGHLAKFLNEVPHIGTLGPPFPSNRTSAAAYLNSIKGQHVTSYGWKTKQRTGIVTHAFTALLASGGTKIVGCMLIQSADGELPSEPGDSGKLWVAAGNRPIGLNLGTTDDPQFAVATDFSALSDYWQFDVH